MNDKQMDSGSLFVKVRDDVYIMNPAVGADTMAVMGAKMSRAPDLRVRWEDLVQHADGEWDFRSPPKPVRDFLEMNLAQYGHASIASMAKAVWVYAHGFGWPAAWLLEDFPLFDGQEVSTRAVDAAKIPGKHGPGSVCTYSPVGMDDLHDAWMELYAEERAKAGKGGWRFDDARVYLPGTTPTGVVITNDVRAIARQMDLIRALGGEWEGLAEQVMAGVSAASPVTTQSVGWRNRQAPGHWRFGVRRRPDTESVTPEQAVDLVQHDTGITVRRPVGAVARPHARSYLDPLWREAPRFRIRMLCSVACARDWHRHRPVMPWRLSVVLDMDDRIVLAPWYRMEEKVSSNLLAKTSDAFISAGGLNGNFGALHALPFGALVELTAVGTLPELLYMLELRATAEGANPEYKAQALEGIRQLCEIVPEDIVREEQLDAALSRDTGHYD